MRPAPDSNPSPRADPASTDHARLPQRPEIDGLRAFAILPIVFYHAGLGCPGGFVGVDIFFVISGFLIGGILLRELESGKMSFARFAERRLRRVGPMLLVLLAVTLLVSWLIAPPFQWPSIGGQTLFALLGLANFKMLALTHGYFGAPAHALPLLHTWSLAVEEQFYLLLPLMLAAGRRWFARRIHVLLLTLFAASLCCSLYWGSNLRAENFYLLPGRAWELLLGCLGAWARQQMFSQPKATRDHQMNLLRLARATPFLGVLGLLVSVAYLPLTPQWPDARAWLPVVSTLLVLAAPAPDGAPSLTLRFLALPPIRFIGLISYSLYLWHWPIIVFVNQYGPDEITLFQRWLMVVGAVALSAISWRWIEQPCRNQTPARRIPTRRLLLGAGAAWLALAVIAREFSRPQSAEEIGSLSDTPLLSRSLGPESIASFDAAGTEAAGGLRLNGPSDAIPRVVLLGSSHGTMLGPVVQALSREWHVPAVSLTHSAMSPLFTGDPSPTEIRLPLAETRLHLAEIRQRDAQVKNLLSQWHPALIILCARWLHEQTDRPSFRPSSQLTFVHEFSNTVQWLGQHCDRVLVVGQVPELPLDAGEDARLAIWRRYRRGGNVMPSLTEHSKSTREREQLLQAFAHYATPNTSIIDPASLFNTPAHTLRYYDSRGLYYWDNNHLNSLGAMQLKPLLEPFVKEAAP